MTNIALTLCVVLIFSFLLIEMENGTKRNEDSIKIEIEATIVEDDKFQLFYLLDGQNGYSEKFAKWIDVIGSKDAQKILFELPDSLKIRKLRIDIGTNTSQESITINQVKVKQRGETLLLKSKDVFKTFQPSRFIQLNQDSTSLKLFQIEERYDPYLSSIDLFELFNRQVHTKEIKESATRLRLFSLGTIAAALALILLVSYFKKSLLLLCFSSLFISIITLPWLIQTLNIELSTNKSLEKRQLAKKPIIDFASIERYPKDYEAYFNDNFGFRGELISWGSYIKSNFFRASINPNKAVFGNDNWLFLSGSFDKILDDFSRKNLYSEKELIAISRVLENRKKHLEERNIKYYKTFWPNKHTIYPEKLPFYIRIQQKDTLSRPDQIISYLKSTNSSVDLLDVREKLIKSKRNAQLYFKHDTHWNEYGAFVGYKELFKKISADLPEIQPLTIDDYYIEWKITHGGDLAGMLGVQNKDYEDRYPVFTPLIKNNVVELPTVDYPKNTIILYNEDCQNDLTILVFRDSFTTALTKFISPHFKKSFFIWSSYDPELVEKVKPDVVVEGYVERLFR